MLKNIVYCFLLLLFCILPYIYSQSVTQEIRSKSVFNSMGLQALVQHNKHVSLLAKSAYPAIVNISSSRKRSYDHITPFEYFFDNSM